MNNHWFDYVKSCYDLVVESEGASALILQHEVEAYVVHLMANNFERTDIGTVPIAIQMLAAVQSGRRDDYLRVADEALLIHSYPIRRQRWPTATYFQDMGTTAYGLAGHMMEDNFVPAGKILNGIFSKMSRV